MAEANDAAVVVLTSETRQKILDQAGSRGWVVNPRSVERCHYLVCCRKQDWDNKADGIPHRAAFLVGRISALQKLDESANARGQARFYIGISEFAGVAIANVWRKELRNPVAYAGLKQLGIDPRRLKFQPMARNQLISPGEGPGRLTIAEAKRALATTFGVKPEDIEIIIKG